MVLFRFAMKFIDTSTLHALQLPPRFPGLMLEASIASPQDLFWRQRKQGSCESEGTIPQRKYHATHATTKKHATWTQ